MNRLCDGWFSEVAHDQGSDAAVSSWAGQAFSLEVEQVVFEQKSKFQDVLVFKSKTYGMALALDGVIQCTERDEFAYHEMMAHIPLFAHSNPKSVLVVGGGDGGVVREVLKHKQVQSVVLCEIDELVVDVSKRFLPTISSGLSDPRVQIKICDGLEYLRGHKNEFDVIITDSSDPDGPAEGLFGAEYYLMVKEALRPHGVIIAQGECPWVDLDLISATVRIAKNVFPVVKYAIGSVPTYTTGTMGYLVCSNDESLNITRPHTTKENVQDLSLQFYSPALHRAAFVLPQFVQHALSSA